MDRGDEPEPAYVLRTQPWRESSFLLELFLETRGRVGCVVRGVRGARAQPLRAVLQPLQPIRVSLRGRGELLQLVSAEAAGPAPRLQGDALLAVFYLNELLYRLLPRHDAHNALFWRYASCLGELEQAGNLAWTLRRFERDLLAALGYALACDHDAYGAPIDATAQYRYVPDRGLLPCAAGRQSIPGAAICSLADDVAPPADFRASQRRLLRAAIAEHLAGAELESWALLAELERLR